MIIKGSHQVVLIGLFWRGVIDVFRDTPILDELDGLVRRQGYDIICAMRERPKFPPAGCPNFGTYTYIPFDNAIVWYT